MEGPTAPLTFKFFQTVHGLEYILLYFWVLKDLSWCAVSWLYTGTTCIAMFISWIVFLFCISIYKKMYMEAYHAVAMCLWLSANGIWMIGSSFHDNYENYGESYQENKLFQCHILGSIAVAWLGVYYFILNPTQHLLKSMPHASGDQ